MTYKNDLVRGETKEKRGKDHHFNSHLPTRGRTGRIDECQRGGATADPRAEEMATKIRNETPPWKAKETGFLKVFSLSSAERGGGEIREGGAPGGRK